jgi:pimeloyl-ACP methyl ester carboxylesterase
VARLSPTGRARTPDGLEIAYYDLGGEGPVLLLAHATGFCGAVLSPLAERLTGAFHCVSFDERGHGASDAPPTGAPEPGAPEGRDFGWLGFAADVLAVVDHLGVEKPLGFGHSCGAAALLLAEEGRPGTFGGLYCYEPIIYAGDDPEPPTEEGNPLSMGARRRRPAFGSRQEALDNFSAKAPFDRLHPEVLVAYVDNGFGPEAEPAAPDQQGIRLRCAREDEAQIYAHGLAHDAFARLGQVRCPVRLACGAETDAIGPRTLERFATRLARSETEVFGGLGHFGPLEDPDTVAASVTAALIDVGDTPRA